jgi:Superinfection immunity protein
MEGDVVSDQLESLVWFGMFLFMYFLPALVAWKRKHRNTSAIGVLNFLLGWTMIGWIGSLVWAFTSNTRVRQLS